MLNISTLAFEILLDNVIDNMEPTIKIFDNNILRDLIKQRNILAELHNKNK